MPACMYMEEMGASSMLAAKRSVGVTPEVNIREHLYMYLHQAQIRLIILAFKPRGEVTRRPYVFQKFKKRSGD